MKQTPLSQQNEDDKFEDRPTEHNLTEDEPLSGTPVAPVNIEGLPKPYRQVHGRTGEEEEGGA